MQNNLQAVNSILNGVGGGMQGHMWNDWQSNHVGKPETNVVGTPEVLAKTGGHWTGSAEQGGEWQQGIEITREITETVENQIRSGIRFGMDSSEFKTDTYRIVDLNIQQFMRSNILQIDITNLKPNTRHYVFFDNEDVNSRCRPRFASYSADGSTSMGAQLKTDSNGTLRGSFSLPANRFTNGTRLLKVTSHKYNGDAPASTAEATYTAMGIIANNEKTTHTTRVHRIVPTPVVNVRQHVTRGERINATNLDIDPASNPFDDFEDKIDDLEQQIADINDELSNIPGPDPDTNTSDGGSTIPDWRNILDDFDFSWMDGLYFDPIAQSFQVPSDVGAGIFAHSVDLYFKTKGTNRDVNVEIRPMLNGYPTNEAIALSKASLAPASVNVSENASQKTTFTFPSPVFLKSGMEYCFVVWSDSDEYECWFQRGGEKDIANDSIVIGPPADHMGSMFVSQNSNTWSARQEDDLKFTLKRCKFDTSQGASVSFINKDVPWYGSEVVDVNTSDTDDVEYHIGENPISTVADSSSVTVNHFMHGHYHTSSNVQLQGIEGDRTGGVIRIAAPADSGSLPADGTYNIIHGSLPYNTGTNSNVGSDQVAITTSGSGDVTQNGVAFRITIATTSGTADISACKILQAGSGHEVGDTITVTVGSSWSFTVDVNAVGDTIGGIPVRALNCDVTQFHTSIGSDFTMDTFSITPNLTAKSVPADVTANADITGSGEPLFPDYVSDYKATDTTRGGGSNVRCSKNIYYDGIHTNIRNILVERTSMFINAVGTAMHSPEGYLDGTVYQRRISGDNIKLNDNAYFDRPSIVASSINQQNEMSNEHSFEVKVSMFSQDASGYVSPVIDLQSLNCIAFANRLNGLTDSLTTVSGFTDSITATNEPEGEENAFCYITKKVNLKTPATGLRANIDVLRHPGTDVKVLYKIVRNDEEIPVDDISFNYFNGTGVPDKPLEADGKNFKEYEYNVDNLPEFSAFIIKIVGQGYNTSKPPVLSAFRCIATG